MSVQSESEVSKSKIEDDIHELESTENELIRILEIVQEVTECLSQRDSVTDETKAKTVNLTREYMTLVDRVCDSLRKHAELMENYYESYRIDNLPLLNGTINHLSNTVRNAEDTVPMDIRRKR